MDDDLTRYMQEAFRKMEAQLYGFPDPPITPPAVDMLARIKELQARLEVRLERWHGKQQAWAVVRRWRTQEAVVMPAWLRFGCYRLCNDGRSVQFLIGDLGNKAIIRTDGRKWISDPSSWDWIAPPPIIDRPNTLRDSMFYLNTWEIKNEPSRYY